MEYILGAVIILLIIIAIFATKANADDAQKKMAYLKSEGIDYKELIRIGNYISGHPEINEQTSSIFLYKEDTKLKIFEQKTTFFKLIGNIPIENIIEITVEDQTSFERRVTLGRVLLVGVFALAWRKKKKNELYFLVIKWNDGKFDHETLFQFNGINLASYSNTVRNKLIQLCR